MSLIDNLKSEFGFMSSFLRYDFNYMEAAARYLKDNKGNHTEEELKDVFYQYVNSYETNQTDPTTGASLEGYIEDCFNGWWNNEPAPLTLQEQYDAAVEHQAAGYGLQTPEDSFDRFIRYQEEQRAEHEHDDDSASAYGLKKSLEEVLSSTPEDMKDDFLKLFKDVTSRQVNKKLKALGVHIDDSRERSKTEKYLLELCRDSSAITALTDGELPLQLRDVAKWVSDRLNGRAVYMQDSKTWYFQRDNKYMSTPNSKDGNPIEEALDDYYNLCDQWSENYPLFSKQISITKEKLQYRLQPPYSLIGNMATHTEEDFNNNVLKEGYICTPDGLYNYLEKKSSSNGLTKVTTRARILNMPQEELLASEGVQLWKQFLNSIQPNPAINDYLECIIANAITGHRDGEYTYIFHGETGANGKSVLMALLQHMLGGYYADYNTDSLVRHSYGETAEQAAKNLENRRLVGGREIGDGITIDSGKFKQYFSNDSYTINEKYKPSYSVMPTHTMFLPVNQMPNFGSDPAVRRRLIVIPFTQHFVDNPTRPNEQKKDTTILKKLIDHEDEIFTYFVFCAQELRKDNSPLVIPATVRKYGDDMTDKTNLLADFVTSEADILTEEQMNNKDIPTPMTTAAELYDRYKEHIKAAPGTYNPYKTKGAFIDALLLKYPQLKDTRAYTTDKKQMRGVICGIWLDPTTTTAKRLESTRWNKELNVPLSYPAFKSTRLYENWKAEHDANEQ